MKYVDSEKLIAEIERRIESWAIRGKNSPAGQGKDTCESRVTELSDLLSFITSLQQDHLPDAGKMVEQEHIADVSKMIEQPEVELKVRAKYMKTLSNDVYVESEFLDIDPESVKMGDEVIIQVRKK